MTLAQIVAAVRGKLDDLKNPPGWSNDFLTGCVNETINELCSKMPMIEDASTAAICSHALLANGYALTLSPRITGIQRVELASTGRVLDVIVNIDQMDMTFPGWKSAASSVPRYFIKDGLGTHVARVWPPTLLADTVNLTVSRLPLADLSWSTDQASSLEIPQQYHDQLYDGILWRAYKMNDADANNQRKAEEHRKDWIVKVEEIRRAHLYKGNVPFSSAPSDAWM